MRTVLAVLAGLPFLFIYLGLLIQIRKIWLRGTNPPKIHNFLLAAHFGRFMGWILVGACVVGEDLQSGLLLMTTRTVAVLLLTITIIQKNIPRPSFTILAKAIILELVALMVTCTALIVLPVPAALEMVLYGYVWLCFGALLFYALPAQILAAWREGTFGLLRWFQHALLFVYIFHLIYGFFATAGWLRILMISVYGIAALLQGILALQVEIGCRRHRKMMAQKTSTDHER